MQWSALPQGGSRSAPHNEVGYDIRAWKDLLKDPSEESLDREAKYLLDFTKKMMREYM